MSFAASTNGVCCGFRRMDNRRNLLRLGTDAHPILAVHPKTGLITASDQRATMCRRLPCTSFGIASSTAFSSSRLPKEEYPARSRNRWTWIPY